MNVATRFIPLRANDKKVTHLKIEVYYSLGGVNYFTYNNEQRGYYIGVTPVQRGNGFESFGAFTGIKECFIPCNRQSKKKADEAANIPAEKYQHLIDYVLKKNGLETAE